jgi:transposase
MPRVSKPLQVSPEELEALNANLAHADKELAERIRIIIACSSENSNKVVASQLQVNEHTVAKWKKAYQDRGIEGLLSAHGGGRKAKYQDASLEDTVVALVAEANSGAREGWTMKALAEKTGASEYQVASILRKRKISLARKHAWSYRTSETDSHTNDAAVLGIYLTGTRCAVITGHHKDGLTVSSGEFSTGNRALAVKIEQSGQQLSFDGALTECGYYPGDGEDGPVTLDEFISETLADAYPDNGTADCIRYGVFVLADEPFTTSRLWGAGTDFSCHKDRKEWLTQVHSWVGARSSGTAIMALEETIEVINRYLDRCQEGKDCTPFIWSRHILQTGPAPAPASKQPTNLSSGAEQKAAPGSRNADSGSCSSSTGTDVGSGSSDTSNNGRRSLLGLYEDIEKDNSVQSGFIFFSRGRNGLEFGSVVNDVPMPDAAFGFDSEQDFLKGMNQLEQQMLSMRDRAGVAATGLYIEQLKKKKGH